MNEKIMKIDSINSKFLSILKRTKFSFESFVISVRWIGGRMCQCKTKPSQSSARNLVRLCDGFCNRFNIKLNGCSPCPVELAAPTTLKSHVTDNGPTESSDGNDHQPDDTERTPPIPTIENSSVPNWNEVCSSLCKNGEGGVLCNCDLSPLNVQ